MIFLNPSQYSNNLYIKINQEFNGTKIVFKHFIPIAIVGTIFKTLSELCLSQPAEKVAYISCKVCESGIFITMLAGVINIFYQLNKNENILKQKINESIIKDLEIREINEYRS